MIGSTIGHYRILRQIGVGGMGEVYAAQDTSLDREVALKLLPPEMAADPERRERFDREAKVIAALDHPNIVTIHSVEHAEAPEGGDIHFITMQLVDGKTLSELIPRSGFPVERFFELAIPLAEAVAVAHEQGITHRDLKPGNVMVAHDGRLKVLDFGLAKAGGGDAGFSSEPGVASGVGATGADDATEAATHFGGADPAAIVAGYAAADLTEEGKVLGTVAYMSPEQAEGKVVDHRSDIFSLGIILYQMATGEPPFQGDTKLSIMSSIVKEAPTSITDLNANLPRHLGRIIKKCLEKDVTRRYQSTLDIRNDLEELMAEVASGEALPVSASAGREARGGAGTAPKGVPWLMIGGAVVATAAVVAVAMNWFGGTTPVGPEAVPVQWRTSRLTNLPGVERQPVLSPDGAQFIFTGDAAGNDDIYMQRVGGGRVFNLTEGSEDSDRDPAYSPDGTRIAFRSDRDGGGIYVMGATGENVRRVVDGGFNPTWSPDGASIAYTNQSFGVPWQLNGPRQVWTLDLETGDTKMLTGEGLQPHWSPNGHRVAYFGVRIGGQRDIWTVGIDGSDPIAVTEDEALDWSPHWSPDGRYLYFSSNRGGTSNIWRVSVDERTGEVLDAPEAVTTGGSDLQGYISVAADGRTLAYTAIQRSTNIMRADFDDASGTVGEISAVTSGPRDINAVDVSSDNEWLVFRSTFPQEDLILMRTDGSGETKLTDDEHRDRTPVFSPDNDVVYFYSDRGGTYQIWSIRTDGTDLTLLTPGEGDFFFPVVSPSGDRLGVTLTDGTFLLDLDTPWEDQAREMLPSFEGTHEFEMSSWSPDGAKLAGALMTEDQEREFAAIYELESGEYEILDGVNGSGFPIWLADSRRVLFTTDKGAIGLHDTVTGETHEVLSLFPDGAFGMVMGPEDGRIYFLRNSTRADIYLLSAEEADGR